MVVVASLGISCTCVTEILLETPGPELVPTTEQFVAVTYLSNNSAGIPVSGLNA